MENGPRPAERQDLTLYRKYRPQQWEDVLGQPHVVTVLTRAIEEGKTTHAYLFAGPRGTGKTSAARLLARRLNCDTPTGADPCGTCLHCRQSLWNADLDLIEIDAASNRSIDDIRSLKERIRLSPTAGPYKVYIVDEVHMLTKEAFNALLKTLEEPPAHALFILATTELHKVPDTVRSRCQTFLFRRAPVALIQERLARIAQAEGIAMEPDALTLIARQGDGCFRDAESILGQVAASAASPVTVHDVAALLGVASIETVQSLVDTLLDRDAKQALACVQGIAEHGVALRRFTEDVTRYLRALASFAVAGVHSETLAPTADDRLHAQAERSTAQDLVALLRLFLRAKTDQRDTGYEELPLELAILEWCQTGAAQQNHQSSRPQVRHTEPTRVPRERTERSVASEQSNPALFTKVASLWRTFLEQSARLNPLLLSTLEACVPVAVRGNTLYLVTSYSLYKDRVSDHGVRTPLEDLLGSLLGERLLLRVAHQKEAASLGLPSAAELPENVDALARETKPATNGLTQDALSILGGEVLRHDR